MKYPFPFLTAAVLAAGGIAATSVGATQIPDVTAMYRCADDQELRVTYYSGGDTAMVRLDDHDISFARAASAYGMRYLANGEGSVLETQGDQAVLYRSGIPVRGACTKAAMGVPSAFIRSQAHRAS